MNSIAVGVQAPRIKRSSNFVKPAPLPFNIPMIIIITYAINAFQGGGKMKREKKFVVRSEVA